MTGSPDQYLIEIVREPTTEGDLVYVARHPELPGCMAHGESADEARANLDEARGLYLADLGRRGIEMPPARGLVRVVTWETSPPTAAPNPQPRVVPSASTGRREVAIPR